MDKVTTDNVYQIFGARILELRKDKHLTQEEIAKVLKTSQGNYRKYEAGEAKVKLSLMIKIADFYNVTLDYLAGLEDEKRPRHPIEVSKDDWQHLKDFHALDAIEQAEIKGEIRGMLRNKTPKKDTSGMVG